MTTFKEVKDRYETSFVITEEIMNRLKKGESVRATFSSGMGYYPYIINSIDHEIEYNRAENGAHAFELKVTSASTLEKEKAFGWMI